MGHPAQDACCLHTEHRLMCPFHTLCQPKGSEHQQLWPTALSTGTSATAEAHCILLTQDNAAKVNGVLYQAQNHAVHCRDWEPRLGTMLAITAESRGITREGTISITQAELDQKKLSSPKFNRVLWFFFFFGVSISFMGPGAGCQHSELLTALCNFCKCPVIKWWD